MSRKLVSIMGIQDLPTDPRRAIEFAKFEFAKGSMYWSRLIIRCLESTMEDRALDIVERAFARKSEERGDTLTKALLEELREVQYADDIRAEHLRSRAFEIWNDPRCRSLFCRGITRLYGAVANRIENNRDAYEIELTRAVGMLATDGNVDANNHEFAIFLQSFEEEFPR